MVQANSKAQAGLEYLMTYGWALILIATLVGVLVFIVSSPASSATFSSSNPTKILMKGGTIDDSDVVEVKLSNITGGTINVTGIELTGAFSTSYFFEPQAKLNGINISLITPSNPVMVAGGGLLDFTEIDYGNDGIGKIEISYVDYAGLSRDLNITGGRGGGNFPYCGDGECTGNESDGYSTAYCWADCFA